MNTTDPNDFRCDEFFFLSNVLLSEQEVEYDNRAVYTQATYDINDQWSATGGARYTWDETKGSYNRYTLQVRQRRHPGSAG